MFHIKQEDIKQEIEYIECLPNIETYDEYSEYYKQEYEKDLAVKEEYLTETRNEQLENEDPLTTGCDSEILIGLQEDSIIKEENVPEINHEQVENKYLIITYCNNELINESGLTKQRSHKTGVKLNKNECITNTNEKPFKCDQCEYSCKHKALLSRHKLKHCDKRPFKCDLCYFRCKEKAYLLTHQLKHSKEKPIKCDKCEYSCKQKRYLLRHNKAKHN